jgi:hypothetical protein
MTSQPPPVIRAGGTYSALAEEGMKNPATRNKIKICGAISLLVMILSLLILAGMSREDDEVNDPDMFQQVLEAGNSAISEVDDDLATYVRF